MVLLSLLDAVNAIYNSELSDLLSGLYIHISNHVVEMYQQIKLLYIYWYTSAHK